MNDKVEQELQRQRQYEQQANKAYQASLGQSTADVARSQIDQGEAQRVAEYQHLSAQPPRPTSAPSSALGAAPATVYEGQLAGQGQQTALASARLGGLTEWDLLQQIKNMRANQNIGIQSNFAHGSQNVLPYEVAQAQHAGDMAHAMGGLAQTAGQLVSLAGIASPFWGASAPAAAQATSSLPADFNFTPVSGLPLAARTPFQMPAQFPNPIWGSTL